MPLVVDVIRDVSVFAGQSKDWDALAARLAHGISTAHACRLSDGADEPNGTVNTTAYVTRLVRDVKVVKSSHGVR